jgi:hypothetical protein
MSSWMVVPERMASRTDGCHPPPAPADPGRVCDSSFFKQETPTLGGEEECDT